MTRPASAAASIASTDVSGWPLTVLARGIVGPPGSGLKVGTLAPLPMPSCCRGPTRPGRSACTRHRLRRAVPAPDGLSGHARRTCQGLRAVCHRRRRFIAAGRARYARVRSTTNVANTMTMTGGISISIAAPMHAGCRATLQGRTPAGRGAQELRRGPSPPRTPSTRIDSAAREGPRSNRRETAQPGPIMPPYGWALALDPTPTGQELSDQGKRLDCTAHAR